MGLKVLNPLIKTVAKKAYVAPKMEVRTLESLGLKMEQLTGDVIQIKNKFLRPSSERIQIILKENGLCSKGRFHLKNGSYGGLADDFEESILSDNNLIFIEELLKKFPKSATNKSNTKLQEMLILLRDINHSGFNNKEKFLQEFLNELENLEKMTTKEGTKFFSDNVIGIYSKKAILDAKYTNPERYKEIMDLFDLNRQGKAPDYLLKTLFPKSTFHELPKSDIQKLLIGENYYPQLESLSESLVSKLGVGEAFSVGKEMFVKTAEGYEKLNIDAQTYERLFPPIQRYAMAQGPLGNCHLISTLDAITKNPNGRIKFYKMFEQTENGVKCTIPGYKNAPVEFNFDDLSMLNIDGYNVNGSLGHRMIEYTYAKNAYLAEHGTTTVTKVEDIIRYFSFSAGEKTIAKHLKNLGNYEMTDYAAGILNTNPQLKNILQERIKTNINIINSSSCLPDYGLYSQHFYNGGDIRGLSRTNPWNTLENISISPFDKLNWLQVAI